jgi:hypothetical protein
MNQHHPTRPADKNKGAMPHKLAMIQKSGDMLVDIFHYLALFCIGSTIVWSAFHH